MTLDPEPSLEPCFSLVIETTAPAVIGPLATGGVRLHLPANSGSLHGSGIRADIVRGAGGETHLDRGDGTVVIEANYLLRTSEGQVLRLIATGYSTSGQRYCGTRMTIAFEVDETSPLAWLSTRVFVAQRDAGAKAFDVALVL